MSTSPTTNSYVDLEDLDWRPYDHQPGDKNVLWWYKAAFKDVYVFRMAATNPSLGRSAPYLIRKEYGMAIAGQVVTELFRGDKLSAQLFLLEYKG